jgi:hypothetical protein
MVPVVVSENAEYNSYVTFYVWNGNTTYPEEILYEKKIFLRDIPSNFYYPIDFETPLQVDGPFFVGYKINYVDINNDNISDDEFAVSIAVNRNYPSGVNTMYVQTNGVWATATEKFGIKTSSGIKPVTCLVDIESFKTKNNIEIYPNPATDVLYINTGILESNKLIHIQLIDQTGKVVDSFDKTSSLDEISLDISQYPQGLYFVNMLIDQDRVTQKILITK